MQDRELAIPAAASQLDGAPSCAALFAEDMDSLTAVARGWQLDFRPVGQDRVDGRVFQATHGGVQIVHACLRGALDQRGTTPPGARTFSIFHAGARSWYGRKTSEESILAFHPDGSFEATSDTEFCAYAVTLSEERLAAACERADVPQPDDLLLNRETILECDAGRLGALKATLKRMSETLNEAPDRLTTPGIGGEFSEELPVQLVRTIASAWEAEHRTRPRLRDRALKLATEYIAAHPRRPVSVSELCSITSASERTLQYAFKERFGVSPKTYLKALRLNGARRELRDVEPDTKTVSEVAMRWGFLHVGQFAADFRRMFGELPSATLRGGRNPTGLAPTGAAK